MRRRDQQHIGSMRRERATAHRAGNDARQVEDLDAGKRTISRVQRPRRCVADPIDGEQREASERTALGMLIPLGKRPARGDDEAGLGGGSLERLPRHPSKARCTAIGSCAQPSKASRPSR